MQALLWPIVTWLIREIVIKFVVLTAIFLVAKVFSDVAIEYLQVWLDTSGIANALGSLPSAAWYFLNMFHVPTGMQLIFSAYVTRFLIRRLPVIG
jgi:hypothetical protein